MHTGAHPPLFRYTHALLLALDAIDVTLAAAAAAGAGSDSSGSSLAELVAVWPEKPAKLALGDLPFPRACDPAMCSLPFPPGCLTEARSYARSLAFVCVKRKMRTILRNIFVILSVYISMIDARKICSKVQHNR